MEACVFHILFNSNYVVTYMNVVAFVYINLAAWHYMKGHEVLDREEIDWQEYEFYHTIWHVLVALSCAALVYSHHGSTHKRTGPTYLTKNLVPQCKPTNPPDEEKYYCSVWRLLYESKERLPNVLAWLDPPEGEEATTSIRRRRDQLGLEEKDGLRDDESCHNKEDAEENNGFERENVSCLEVSRNLLSERTALKTRDKISSGSTTLKANRLILSSSTSNMALHTV
jgi:hypothetical protein